MKLPMKLAILLLVLCLGLIEISVRILGIADVPIREANNITGYIPKPNQNGRFIGNSWTINEMQMISRKPFTREGEEILIAGDSVVFGGNLLNQTDRVGEQLDALLSDANVYAVADNSWGFKNSLNYIENNFAALRKLEVIVFVLNSGDFGAPSSWRCNSIHPVDSPTSHFIFALKKYFLTECLKTIPPHLVVPDYDIEMKLSALGKALPNTAIKILLYQNRDEWNKRKSLKRLLKNINLSGASLSELLDYRSEWKSEFYMDNIHPNSDGARALATILEKIIANPI